MAVRGKKRTVAKRKKKAAASVPVSVPAGPPSALPVALGSLADLAVEWWRLERWAIDDAKIVGRHVARRVARFLEENGIEVVDLTGKPFEAGLAAEVLESIPDATLAPGEQRVEETVSPIVLWKGTVVKQGQVVTKRNA